MPRDMAKCARVAGIVTAIAIAFPIQFNLVRCSV